MIINFECGEIVTMVGKCEGMRRSVEFKDMAEYEEYRKHMQEDMDRMAKFIGEDLPKAIEAIAKAAQNLPQQSHGGCSCGGHGHGDVPDPVMEMIQAIMRKKAAAAQQRRDGEDISLKEKKEDISLKPKEVELRATEDGSTGPVDLGNFFDGEDNEKHE